MKDMTCWCDYLTLQRGSLLNSIGEHSRKPRTMALISVIILPHCLPTNIPSALMKESGTLLRHWILFLSLLRFQDTLIFISNNERFYSYFKVLVSGPFFLFRVSPALCIRNPLDSRLSFSLSGSIILEAEVKLKLYMVLVCVHIIISIFKKRKLKLKRDVTWPP